MKNVLLIFVIWCGLSFSIQAETTSPNPGLQLEIANVCSSAGFFDLNNLLATSGADLGGLWTVGITPAQFPSPPIPDLNGIIEISSSGNLPPLSYTYTVTNSICSDSADYIMQVLPSPTILIDTTCLSETLFDLTITINGISSFYDVTSTAFTGTQVAMNGVPLPTITLSNTPPTSYSISVTDQSGLMCDSTLIFNTPTCICPSITAGTDEEYICSEDSANDLLSFFPPINNPNGNPIIWVTDVNDPINTQYNGGILTNMGCSPDTIVYYAMIECNLSATPVMGWVDLDFEYTVYVYPNNVASFVTSNGIGTCITSITIDPSCATYLFSNMFSQTATTGSGMGIHTYELTYDSGISGLNCIVPNPFTIDIIYNCPVQCPSPEINPFFTITDTYCLNESPNPLPTTSDNGITGTWSPSTINTNIAGADDYIFTPNNPAQCATITVMIIIVNENMLPIFTQLGPYCLNDNPDVLPTISDNGITGTWDASISTTIAGTTTYTFTPDDPAQCASNSTMTIDTEDCSCPVSLYVPGPITNNLYEASYNIYSDGNVSNTPVTFHANNYIDLLPNFDVPLNTQFTADIKPCGTTP